MDSKNNARQSNKTNTKAEGSNSRVEFADEINMNMDKSNNKGTSKTADKKADKNSNRNANSNSR